MPLKMHRSVVSYAGYYKDTENYSVFCGKQCIGYIHENGRAPGSLRWFWVLHAPSKPAANQVATLEEAQTELEAIWNQSKAGARGRVP